MQKLLIVIIRAYRYIVSPYLGPCCRFSPTCSEYAEQAIKKYGPLKGVIMSVKRLFKCHPYHAGGYDPVV